MPENSRFGATRSNRERIGQRDILGQKDGYRCGSLTTGCGFLGPREVSRKPLDALCFCCYRPSQSKLPILLGVEVAKSEQWQCIPTRLSIEQFQQFVLPHLSIGSRGPAPKLTLHAVFNYILQSLYLGCQWKELPIFAGSVLKLHQANLLDTTVIHGDGTTTAAKKGGDNIGF